MEHTKETVCTPAAVRFSVVLPTYNRAFCICNAIDSLLAQSYGEFELVLVDDGSTDGTEQLVAKTYARELAAGHIRYYRQENAGVCAARNKGLSLAQNDWIVYLDSDNRLEKDFLAAYRDAIAAHPDYSIFYSQMKRDTGAVIGQELDYRVLVCCNLIDLGNFVHHKSLCKKYGVFDTHLKRLVDWDLLLRYTRFEKAFFINKVLLQYADGTFARITNTESLEEAALTVRKKLHTVFHPFSELTERRNFIEVFFDTDSGFSENEKALFASFPVIIKPRAELKALRIDPSACPCIVTAVQLTADGEPLSYQTNAWKRDGDTLYFDTADPQLFVALPDSAVQSFTFDMQVFPLDEQTAQDIQATYATASSQASVIAEQTARLQQHTATITQQAATLQQRDATIEELNDTIQQQAVAIEDLTAAARDYQRYLQTQLLAVESAVQQKQQEIAALYESRSWRLTKPLRDLRRLTQQLRHGRKLMHVTQFYTGGGYKPVITSPYRSAMSASPFLHSAQACGEVA